MLEEFVPIVHSATQGTVTRAVSDFDLEVEARSGALGPSKVERGYPVYSRSLSQRLGNGRKAFQIMSFRNVGFRGLVRYGPMRVAG
jgi:hypothetical protein